MLDTQTLQKKASFGFLSVNHPARQPEGTEAVTDDDNSIEFVDGDNGERIAQLLYP